MNRLTSAARAPPPPRQGARQSRANFLRSHAEEIASSLIQAWPCGDCFSRRCFELLRQAYVNPCYFLHYEISARELAWLGEHGVELQQRVKQACEQRLDELQAALPRVAE